MRLFLPVIMLIAGCLFSPPIISAAAEKVVLELRWDHQFQFVGYYAAKWQEYYAEGGFDVQIRSALS